METKQDSPPPKSLIHRASAKAASASASVLGGISKLNPITQTIVDAKQILKERKNELLDEPRQINARNRRLSQSENNFVGPMGRPIDKARQKRIQDVYKRAIEILDSKRVKLMALTNSAKYLAEHAVREAYHESSLFGGKKKGKSRKSSKTRKNRKTRSRK